MAKRSPLLELQRLNGGEIREREDGLVPIHFGDPLAEYHAVETGVGLFDLFQRSFLKFSGSDRVSFLNGMVSNDVKPLAPGQGLHAAFLDIQGKILADARIFCMQEALLVDVPELCKERIIQHLERHLVADEVTIQDLAADFLMVSLQGPQAGPLMREATSIATLPRSELEHLEAAIAEQPLLLIRVTHICQEGYDLILPRSEATGMIRRIQEIGNKFSLSWAGTEAQEMLRIEAGIPRYGVDMTEDNLLLETGLNHAVNFHKGCYLGQEIVERIHSRGHVNKRLVGLILETKKPANRGEKVYREDREIGRVTSSAFSPRKRSALALGYVQHDFSNPGTTVTVKRDEGEISAEISSLSLDKTAS
ncbi:MAG: YgfZ/GcvT domain-containing protein [Candidatus Binatia bacterium]